ncbi:hypothetical protein A2J04_26545 [Rhodococcus sp. EPR-279]|nr:hypothetical protein A2J02_26540 [Rhodococcus sp. EPR-147]KZF03704.1 hypothetical protein A2J04_26545 [Rhodococcus sp. EPR-279]
MQLRRVSAKHGGSYTKQRYSRQVLITNLLVDIMLIIGKKEPQFRGVSTDAARLRFLWPTHSQRFRVERCVHVPLERCGGHSALLSNGQLLATVGRNV